MFTCFAYFRGTTRCTQASNSGVSRASSQSFVDGRTLAYRFSTCIIYAYRNVPFHWNLVGADIVRLHRESTIWESWPIVGCIIMYKTRSDAQFAHRISQYRISDPYVCRLCISLWLLRLCSLAFARGFLSRPFSIVICFNLASSSNAVIFLVFTSFRSKLCIQARRMRATKSTKAFTSVVACI